jgi:hypothetical protein
MEVDAITDAVVSHAMASGYFETVNSHEPKNSPGNGLTCAAWAQSVVPIPQASGLNTTTGRILFNVRLYSPMLHEPQDGIDPELIKAVDALMTAYSGDFTLDGLIRNVDLLGTYGIALFAQAGYQSIGGADGQIMYRIMTISVPLIVNDLWGQTP